MANLSGLGWQWQEPGRSFVCRLILIIMKRFELAGVRYLHQHLNSSDYRYLLSPFRLVELAIRLYFNDLRHFP